MNNRLIAIIRSGLMTLFLSLLTALPAFSFAGSGMATEPSALDGELLILNVSVRQRNGDILQVPIFSEKYADLPLAVVDGEPIVLADVTRELAAMHSGREETGTPVAQKLDSLLDRLVAIKLIRLESYNIGFDRTPDVRKQLDNFALKAMVQGLLAREVAEVRVSEEEVDELYREMAVEVQLLTYSFKSEADAEALLAAVEKGSDFKEAGAAAVADGKAAGGGEGKFSRLNDLFPEIARAAYDMSTGEVSKIFKADQDFLVFQLLERRVYDDPAVRQEAASRLVQKRSREVQYEYLEALIDKHAKVDEEVEQALDFATILAANPGMRGSELFPKLSRDKRTLATVGSGADQVQISVAQIADKIKASMYHGLEREMEVELLVKEKEKALWNTLVAEAGRIEARREGIDQTPEFKSKMTRFEEEVLFDTFMSKAVVPGITIPEEEARAYYQEHRAEYTSPLMLKLKSLVFNDSGAAQDAVAKLQAGSDFNWVSANVENLADGDQPGILKFDGVLLAAGSLPDTLHHDLEGAQVGDVHFYAGEQGLYYALQVETAFPSVTKPYEDVRQEVGRIVYAQKINEALEEWVAKLKEAYETEIFLVRNN